MYDVSELALLPSTDDWNIFDIYDISGFGFIPIYMWYMCTYVDVSGVDPTAIYVW
jgi:hypothetical protein